MSLIDLETRTVSRKTPRDGRLAISEAVARRLVGGDVPPARAPPEEHSAP